MLVVGIDPGLSGALASWDGGKLKVIDMPVMPGRSRGRDLDYSALSMVWDETFFWADHAWVELVASRPKEGVSSAFKFGCVYGGIRGIIAAKVVPCTPVTPNVWKKHYGIQASKSGAVRRASELFPAYAELFRGPKGGLKDGRAEAALIAKYGFDKLENAE